MDAAQEILDEARNRYKGVLSVARHGKEQDLKVLVEQYGTLMEEVNYLKKNGATAVKIKSETTKMDHAYDKVTKAKAELQRIEDAIKAAGASKQPPDMYYWPTEDENAALEKDQKERMINIIDDVVKGSMAAPK